MSRSIAKALREYDQVLQAEMSLPHYSAAQRQVFASARKWLQAALERNGLVKKPTGAMPWWRSSSVTAPSLTMVADLILEIQSAITAVIKDVDLIKKEQNEKPGTDTLRNLLLDLEEMRKTFEASEDGKS